MAKFGPAAVSKFAALVKRHDRLLTVLGALVVFLGFFLKEQFMAEAEDIKAKIRTERSTFEHLRTDPPATALQEEGRKTLET